MTRASRERTGIRVRITELAAQAIVDQADYYSGRQDDLLAARWENAVAQAVESLLNMPERGSLCRFSSARLKALRRIPVPGLPQHLVFYQYIRDPRLIRVVHVLHGARDIEMLMTGLEL